MSEPDIVARLRQTHRVECDCVGCEAAAEIERLRDLIEGYHLTAMGQRAEIKRLCALVAELEGAR